MTKSFEITPSMWTGIIGDMVEKTRARENERKRWDGQVGICVGNVLIVHVGVVYCDAGSSRGLHG